MNGKKGGQEGNQNARKHGFYSKVLTQEERLDYERAVEVEGVDDEIALLRVKIKSLVEKDPENVMLITKAINSLVRLLRSKYEIGRGDKKTIKDAMATVLRDVALPLGIGIGNSLGKHG